VLEDADFDVTVPGLLFGTFFHGGQICTSGTRILAPRARHDELVERLVAAADRIVVGDPWNEDTNIGPLAFEAHRANVERYVGLGLQAGATVARGGRRPPGISRGWYYEPTILTNVDNSMQVAREEVFGPVVCVIPYDDEEEALRIANDTPYGLAASVWSADIDRAQRCASRIQAGTVWINDYHLLNVRFPFGGRKGSGFGKEFSPWGLTEYVTLKHMHIGQMGDPEDKFYTDMLLPPG
jgi:aldehyde dehydrogenase (NAD+)